MTFGGPHVSKTEVHPWDLFSDTEPLRAGSGFQLPSAHPPAPTPVEVLEIESELLEQGALPCIPCLPGAGWEGGECR